MDPASLWPGGVGHPYLRRLNQCAQRALNEGQVVGRTDLLFGRSCQLCSQCRCSPHFLGRCLLSFLVPLCRLLDSTIVVLHLHQHVSADREQFSTLQRAGAEEKNSAPSFVDKPLVDEHLHGLRLIRHRFASHSASSSSSVSFSILSSLLDAISAFVSAHLSLRTRNKVSSLISKDTSSTTIFRTWHSSWARSERTTWTNSCSLPYASVSSTSCPYSS